MELLNLALILLGGVIVSAILNQIFPKIALPLFQAAIGIVAAIFIPTVSSMQFDPDVFLVVFIAPLLFLEAKNADLKTLLKNIKPIISLAIFLVLVTMFALGLLLNALIPVISIAAAVALGAALGPTDAVAVSSLSKTIRLPKWEHSIMEGEMLFNDASGIVGFQCALVVATTATFSMAEALGDFALEFFGGIIVGLIFGFVFRWIINRIVKLGVEGTTFYVLFEVLTPFVIYLASSAMGVSGIIAVVVAGLFKIVDPSKFGSRAPRLVIASKSIWSVLSFALNGIVFILLGTQLPAIFTTTFGGGEYSSWFILLVSALLTVALFLVRFLWAYGMEIVHFRKVDRATLPEFERNLSLARRALITSLTGAKGAVTLSIMFTLPLDFPNRDLMICIASAVIIMSLLVSIFVVPLITPKKEQDDSKKSSTELSISILRSVVNKLTDNIRESSDETDNTATIKVINTINKEIRELSDSDGILTEKKSEILCKALNWEEERLEQLIESAQKGNASIDGILDELVQGAIVRSIDQRREAYESNLSMTQRDKLKRSRSVLKKAVKFSKATKEEQTAEQAKNLVAIERDICEYVITKLREADGQAEQTSAEMAAVISSYQSTYAVLISKSNASESEQDTSYEEAADQAYDLIVMEINHRVYEGQLDKETARSLKSNMILLKTSAEMTE